MERIDLLAMIGLERQVKVRRLLVGLEEAQRCFALRCRLDAVGRRALGDDRYAKRLKRLKEECLARRVVSDAEFDVVEHEYSESLLVCGNWCLVPIAQLHFLVRFLLTFPKLRP